MVFDSKDLHCKIFTFISLKHLIYILFVSQSIDYGIIMHQMTYVCIECLDLVTCCQYFACTITLTTTSDSFPTFSFDDVPDTHQNIKLSLEFFNSFKFGSWDAETLERVHQFLVALLNKWNVSATKWDHTIVRTQLNHYEDHE